MQNLKPKVAIIGAGSVGSTFAFALMLRGIAREIVVVDKNEEKAKGECMDLNHGMSFTHPIEVSATGYEGCKGSDIVVITAGAKQKRGQGYLGFNMFEDAVREYKKALILDPYNMEAINWLGFSYKKMKDYGAAEAVYKDAIARNPDNIVAYFDLGTIYVDSGEYEKALEFFTQASAIKETDTFGIKEDFLFYHRSCLDFRAILLQKLGRKEEALKANEDIIRQYTDNPQAAGRARERMKDMNI